MKKVLLLLLCVAITLPILYAQDETKRVAILETVDKLNNVAYAHKLMLQVNLAMAITNTPGYEAYDRTDLGSIMDEQEFQRTGLVSAEQIKKLGEMTGASYVLVAEAARVDNDNMYITAKILNVETTKMDKIHNVMMGVTPEAILKGCEELASKLLGQLVPSAPPRKKADAPTISHKGEYGGETHQPYVENALGVNMQFVWVEGGSFLMGCTSGDSDEQNVHRVNLDGFYIAQYEVTQAQWEKVMGTNISQQREKANDWWKELTGDNAPFAGVNPNNPMYYVSWTDAMTFCRILSERTGKKFTLPTEAQWEYAARGGNKYENTKYAGSNSIEMVAWFEDNSSGSSQKTGSLRPNILEIYDMSGNVCEWCKDWYYKNYTTNEENNPQGPSSGYRRVIRGGDWFLEATCCRISARQCEASNFRNFNLGFRVVLIP